MKALKLARVEKDLTQKQLSELLGMSIATVNRLENGAKSIEDIRVRDLRKICNVLGLDIVKILNINN